MLRLRLRSLFRRSAVERELDAEMEFHIAKQVEENRAAGMSEEEQALFEELEREAKGGVTMPDHADEKVVEQTPTRVAESRPTPQKESAPPAQKSEPRRTEPEPG